MEEHPEQRQSHDTDESRLNEQIIEASIIFEKLFEVCEEIGYELDPTDLEYILGEDENDFLGNIASFALEQLGLDPEVLYERLGIDAEFKMRRFTFGMLAEEGNFAQHVYILALNRRRTKQTNDQET